MKEKKRDVSLRNYIVTWNVNKLNTYDFMYRIL